MTTLSRPVIFALVGALGFACQLGVLHLLVKAGIPVAVGTALAVATAVAHNFLWHRGWTWRDRAGNGGSPRAQFLRFAGLNGLVSLAGNVVITATLAAAGMPVLGANVVAVVACSVANYALADRLVFATAAVLMTAGMADAAVLESRTLAGWQEYVQATELRIASEEADRSAGAPAADRWRRLRAGDVWLSQRETRRRDGSAIDVPGGAVHHWVGQVFLPGVALKDVLAELQAPTSRAWVPAEVLRLRVTADPNGGLRVFMRVQRDSLVDVTYDIEHAVQYRTQAAGHATSRSASRHIVQVDDPGTPAERGRPEGQDYGFMWRLNAYWRYVPVDGGVLVVCESIALSRNVPSVVRVVAAPMIDRVSRESLENTLRALRTGFAGRESDTK
jgi:putative flippase GtrA